MSSLEIFIVHTAAMFLTFTVLVGVLYIVINALVPRK